MKIILIILGIIALIALLTLLFPLKVVFKYKGESILRVYAYGFKVYDSEKKRERKSKKQQQNVQQEEQKPKDESTFLEKLKKNFDILKQIIKLIVEKAKKYAIIENIEVKYRFGLSDAAITGIYSGVVYGVVNGFAAYLRNYFKIENQKLDIVPDFDNNVQEFEAKIVLVIRVMFFIPVFNRLLKLIHEKKEV